MMRATLSAIAVCLLFPGGSYGSSVNVTVKCQNGTNCDARGVVLLQSVVDKSVVRRVTLSAPTLVINGQPGSEWEMTLEAKGHWALPQRVVFPAKAPSSSYVMDVWRTGTLQGQLKFPDPQPAGAVPLKVMIASRPEPRVPPKLPRGTSFECETEKAGRWKCAVPATLLDIGLRVEGYAPHHVWDVKVAVDGVTDLGTIKLQKGATVVAWLDGDFVKRVDVPVRALLRHEAAPAVSATGMRLGLPVAEAVFSKKGVVQLSPLAPGRYVLEAQAKGYAPARVPVQVYEGRVTTPRRSIELSPALRVRLLLQPPLGPGGAAWRVELWRTVDSGSGSQKAGAGTASPEGIFDAADQIEGPVRVFLKDSKQNTLASREIVISSAIDEYHLSLDVSLVSGTVTIGDSPLPSARLLFGGSGGAEKVRASTNDDGRFTAHLPRRGKWTVDVEEPKEAVAATIEVTIDEDDVDISLPATEVSGWVRDPDGQRLPAARVTLFSNGGTVQRTSDVDGTFRFRGVQEGSVYLRASDPRTRAYSKSVEVTLMKDGRVDNVALDLENVRSLKGIVRSNGQVVVGALVHGWAFLGESAQREVATTDLQGNFTLDVPDAVVETFVTVAAPGRTLGSFRVATRQDSIALELAPYGGKLRLRWPPGALPLQFMFNDHFLASTDVFDWARAQRVAIVNGAREIPNVAPGKYRFCSAKHCAEGLLAAGGELELDASPR